MPLRIAAFVAGGLGLLAINPDHAKALIVAIGGGFGVLAYSGLRYGVPVYVSARKQLRQLQIDLLAMGEQVEGNKGQIDVLRREAAQAREQAEAAEARAKAAEAHAEAARADAERDKKHIVVLKAAIGRLEHGQAGLQVGVTSIGEAVLIQGGDMIDPVKARAAEGRP